MNNDYLNVKVYPPIIKKTPDIKIIIGMVIKSIIVMEGLSGSPGFIKYLKFI